MLWTSLLVLVSFLPPCWETSVAASAWCTAGSDRLGFLFVLSLLITFEFPQYNVSRLTHPLLLFSIYFMLPTLSQPPPWDSSTPLPCSDSFWEKWQLEQLQSSPIADAGQCPVPGQWHVEWTPQVPFSSLTCTPRDNYTFIATKRTNLRCHWDRNPRNLPQIHHYKQKLCAKVHCRYTELLRKPSPDLLFDKATVFMWFTCPCNKRGIYCEVPEVH